MPLCSFNDLFSDADARQPALSVAVAGGADPTVLEAVRVACSRKWIRPLLASNLAAIRRVADESAVSLDGLAIVDADDPAVTAVELVRRGQASLLMKGQVATPALLHAMLDPMRGLRTKSVICQVVLMEIQPTGRRFLLADTGICIAPTLEQKSDILRRCVDVAHALGEANPRVAVMAATETVHEAMPETLDAAELQRRGEAGEFPGCIVEGPLSFDLAYAAEAAEKKRIGGGVAGSADILLFPNLLAANLTVKAIMYTADCRFGGILCGAACPVVFMSRADTTETRMRSLALALCLCERPRVSPT